MMVLLEGNNIYAWNNLNDKTAPHIYNSKQMMEYISNI